jgi:hypothetical protein
MAHAMSRYGTGPLIAPSHGPWLRIQQSRQWTIVQLTLLEAPGVYRTHTARIDNNMVKAWLLKYGVRVGELEIGFSLGGLWKSIKKVAKKVGITKVLSIASKVGKSILSNPIVNAVLPVTILANQALKVTHGLISAAGHLVKGKKGDKVSQAKAVKLINATKVAAKHGSPIAKTALKQAKQIAPLLGSARSYNLILQPM